MVRSWSTANASSNIVIRDDMEVVLRLAPFTTKTKSTTGSREVENVLAPLAVRAFGAFRIELAITDIIFPHDE